MSSYGIEKVAINRYRRLRARPDQHVCWRHEVVISRNANAKDARLAEVMAAVTRHLHAAVKEIEPTQEEWFEAIQF